MQIPGAHILTLVSPSLYTDAQLDKACEIAHQLNRGRFILLEEPQR
jgi:hypothetical protein